MPQTRASDDDQKDDEPGSWDKYFYLKRSAVNGMLHRSHREFFDLPKEIESTSFKQVRTHTFKAFCQSQGNDEPPPNLQRGPEKAKEFKAIRFGELCAVRLRFVS